MRKTNSRNHVSVLVKHTQGTTVIICARLWSTENKVYGTEVHFLHRVFQESGRFHTCMHTMKRKQPFLRRRTRTDLRLLDFFETATYIKIYLKSLVNSSGEK